MASPMNQLGAFNPQQTGLQNQSINQTMTALGRQVKPANGMSQANPGQSVGNPSQGNGNPFGPLKYLLGPLPHLANYFAPQQTQNGVNGIKNFLFGGQESQFQPEQLQALMQLLSGGMNQLQNPYEGFEGIENHANQNFQQNIVPSLAERFTSMGGRGSAALSSPAFASQLGQAGAGLSTGLGALRAQYGQQNRQNALGQIGLGLQPNQTQQQGGLSQSLLPLLFKAGSSYATGGLL